MVKYSPSLTQAETNQVNIIAKECGILFDTARLLFYRKIDTVSKAKRYLNPGKNYFYSPFLMTGMLEGVERITKAKLNGEKVLIFGDYDADGICATTVLYRALKDFGITARCMIPERVDGYGLNVERILLENQKEKIDLIITVDCGVSDKEKVDILKQSGIDLLITDHHEVPSILPNCTVINPKKNGETYPFSALCGAGVAYKLASALIGETADKYLDLVALATIADSMELRDENRDIVREGLKIFNSKELRLPFMFLLQDNKKPITAQTLAYTIAPRINAGGRMGDALTALLLLLEDSPEKIAEIAEKLSVYNTLRQEGCDKIFTQAVQIIQNEKLYKDRVILVQNKDWQTGFLGIVAVWIVEKYNRPAIVFSNQDGYLKGSARSVDGVNIYDAINASKELTLTFGGHSQAAGVSIEEKNFTALRENLCAFVEKNYGNAEPEKEIHAEWNITKPVLVKFAKEINLLEPFGVSNPKPYFTVDACSALVKPLKIGSPHYAFITKNLEILHFNGKDDLLKLLYPVNKKLLVELNYSEFRGRESVKGFLKQIECDYASFANLDEYVFRNELEKIKSFSSEKAINIVEKQIKKGYGTIYVVSDLNNMPLDVSGLKTFYFDVPLKNSTNCIVVSPINIPTEYENVVYIDQNFSLDGEYKGQKRNTKIDKISLDREVFAKVFSLINEKQNTLFTDSVKLYYDLKRENKTQNISVEQFIFCMQVFMELNFFYEANGVLVKNTFAKAPLTNSKIYSRIQKIKSN